MLTIRGATLEDLGAITEIYNEAILNTDATFDTEPKTPEEQEIWFKKHGTKYPIFIVEQDGQIVGWASLSKWSDRCAYLDTAEISFYVDKRHRRQGIGRRMIKEIILEGKKGGLHTVIARVSEGNVISIHLLESMGFKSIGTMKEVGRKFGRLLDVHLMQLIYNSQ